MPDEVLLVQIAYRFMPIFETAYNADYLAARRAKDLGLLMQERRSFTSQSAV